MDIGLPFLTFLYLKGSALGEDCFLGHLDTGVVPGADHELGFLRSCGPHDQIVCNGSVNPFLNPDRPKLNNAILHRKVCKISPHVFRMRGQRVKT